MKIVKVKNTTQNTDSTLTLKLCDTFFSRLMGLMFKRNLGKLDGILLVMNQSSRRLDAAIHMFFMFMDIGVVWLDSNCIVVDKVLAKKWRPVYMPRHPARYIMEINENLLKEFSIGDIVKIL